MLKRKYEEFGAETQRHVEILERLITDMGGNPSYVSPAARGVEGMEEHSHFKRWGAAYILLGLFVVSWAGQLIAMLMEIGNEARQHGGSFTMDEFWPRFFSATFENWQSEWLQLLVQAAMLLGLKHVLFKADALDMEQVQLDLAEIKEKLSIPPRDDVTQEHIEDVQRIRDASQQQATGG